MFSDNYSPFSWFLLILSSAPSILISIFSLNLSSDFLHMNFFLILPLSSFITFYFMYFFSPGSSILYLIILKKNFYLYLSVISTSIPPHLSFAYCSDLCVSLFQLTSFPYFKISVLLLQSLFFFPFYSFRPTVYSLQTLPLPTASVTSPGWESLIALLAHILPFYSVLLLIFSRLYSAVHPITPLYSVILPWVLPGISRDLYSRLQGVKISFMFISPEVHG